MLWSRVSTKFSSVAFGEPTALVRIARTSSSRMRSIGGQWIYNREYRSLEHDMKTLMAVNTDSLRALMREFTFDPMTIVTLGPGK